MNFSRLSIGLLALISLAGIMQQWSDVEAVHWWRYGAAILVLGLVYEWMWVRGLVLSASCVGPVQLRLAREENMVLRFASEALRECAIEYAHGLPGPIVAADAPRRLDIDALGECETVFTARAIELGRFRWSEVPTRVRGPLGLGWWPRRVALDAELQVTPDLAAARGSPVGVTQVGDKAARVGSGLELHHLRDYVPGDPRHTVDWKATARTQQLVTRVFSEEQHLDIMLVLDIGRTSRTQVDDLSQLGHYVNLAARFAQHAAACGDHIGLIAAADKPLAVIAPQRGDTAVMRIHEALRGLQSVPVETDILSAARRVQEVARKRCLIILLTDLYGQSIDGGFGKSLKFWNTRHLPVVVSLIGSEVADIPNQAATRMSDPFLSLGGEVYQGSLRSNAAAARRLGAQAIVARPRELQSRVFAEYQLLKQQHRV